MRILKKISYYLTVFVLAILLSDAYPDFSDNCAEDNMQTETAISGLNQLVHCFITTFHTIKHVTAPTLPLIDCHHNIDLDVFIPSSFIAIQSPPAFPYRILADNQFIFNQVYMEVIPLPPCPRS